MQFVTSIFVGLLVGVSQSSSTATAVLPSVEFADLITMDDPTVVSVTNSLVTLGTIQIVGIPNFRETRAEALESFAECILNERDSVESKVMTDGSVRLTSQAAATNGIPGIMSGECGASSTKLRSVIDAATRQLFLVLDKASPGISSYSDETLMAPYRSYEDLMRRGQHLEHMHAYFGPEEESKASSGAATIDYHTDAGLMIAMTTGFYGGQPASEASGLYIQMPTGAKVHAMVADDALIIMVGEGGARWLNPALGAPLRAVPHALVADLATSSTRSWFGKMYLPPADAVVPQEGIPYAQYRDAQNKALAAGDRDSLLPSACSSELLPSGAYAANRQLVESTMCTTADGETGINCWTICMSVAGLKCGTNAECVNPAGDITPPEVHCKDCVPSCEWNTNSTDFDGYCYGTGVSMFMQGFGSIATSERGSTACVNLLFVDFTLDTPVKFAFACVGVLLLGIFVQYLTRVRFQIARVRPVTTVNNVYLVVIHAVQVTLGYFLMLIAMTYSTELFCMVCLGLSIGFALFNLKVPQSGNTDACCPPETEEMEATLRKPHPTCATTPAPDCCCEEI